MAREDLLSQLMIQLTQKEGPPPADDNTLIQKMIAPNETMTASDSGVTLSVLNPSTFVWGGDPVNLIGSPQSQVGSFEPSLGGASGNGAQIVSVTRPDNGYYVRAILLPKGQNVPVQSSASIAGLQASQAYTISFDCWTDSTTNGVQFDSDVYLNVAPNTDLRFLPSINGNNQLQHVNWTFNTNQLSALQNQLLRFFNDVVQPNPSNIWITNIQLTAGSSDPSYISPGWKWSQGQYK